MGISWRKYLFAPTPHYISIAEKTEIAQFILEVRFLLMYLLHFHVIIVLVFELILAGGQFVV